MTVETEVSPTEQVPWTLGTDPATTRKFSSQRGGRRQSLLCVGEATRGLSTPRTTTTTYSPDLRQTTLTYLTDRDTIRAIQ